MSWFSKKVVIVKDNLSTGEKDQIIGQGRTVGSANKLLSEHIARGNGLEKSREIMFDDGTKKVEAFRTNDKREITEILKFETLQIGGQESSGGVILD